MAEAEYIAALKNMLDFTPVYDIITVSEYTEACIARKSRMIPETVS